MAGELTITATAVKAVEIVEQKTAPAGLAISAGEGVILDSNGKWVKSNAAAAGTVTCPAIALSTVKANMPLTALRKGSLSLGDALNAVALGAAIKFSNTAGKIATAAGTVDVTAGTVEPVWNATTPKKVLRVDL